MSNLTAGDIKILQLAWQCFLEEPKVDAEKLAELGGYKNKESARVVYNAAKRKLAAGATMATGTEDGASPAKSTPKKRASTGGEGGSAKKKGRKSKAEIAAAEEGADDEGKVKVKAEEGEDGAEKLTNGNGSTEDEV